MIYFFLFLMMGFEYPNVVDKRNIEMDNTFNSAYYQKWEAWKKVYVDYQTKTLVKSDAVFENEKISAEYRVGDQIDFLKLKSEGFTGVVFLFDTEDQIDDVVSYLMKIKFQGFKILLSYCPRREDIGVTVFPDVDRLRLTLVRCGGLVDGYILGWRRTSVHLFQKDLAYMNFFTTSVRTNNPNLPIIGEIYAGDTNSGLGYNYNSPMVQITDYCSVVIVVNYIDNNINENKLRFFLQDLFASYKLMIVSQKKENLISRFKEAGFKNFIILKGNEK